MVAHHREDLVGDPVEVDVGQGPSVPPAGDPSDLAAHAERGRDGHTGARQEGAIGFAALRGGTVAGEHSVILAGEEERLTLSHSAENRSIFARGAIRAAEWLIGRAPGRYAMNEVLGL